MKNLTVSLSARATPTSIAVTVRGADDILRALSTDDLEASVDLSGLGPGRYTLDVRVTSSRALGFVRVSPAQAQIVIR